MSPFSPQDPAPESTPASPWPRVLAGGVWAAMLTGSAPLLWPQTPVPAALAAAAVAALVAGVTAWARPLGSLPLTSAEENWRGERLERPERPEGAEPTEAPPTRQSGTYTVPSADAILRDAETGMFHRPAFLALAERDWLRAGRYGGAVALLLVEVDRLRPMTEQMGARVADALLAGLGRQVAASLRAADLLARYDDAQLAVFLPQADATGALDVADRIREMVAQLRLPGLPDGAAFTASVGVAVLGPLHHPLDALVQMTLHALQTARNAGGNCVRAANTDEPWQPLRNLGAGAAGAASARALRPLAPRPRNPGKPGKPEWPQKPGRSGDL